MKLILLAFGITKEILNSVSNEIELQEKTTVKDLKIRLETEYPEMKDLKSCMIAVNNEYAEDDLVLQSKDEIAIIPPVSGG